MLQRSTRHARPRPRADARFLMFSGRLRDSNANVWRQTAVVPEILRNGVDVTAAACESIVRDRRCPSRDCAVRPEVASKHAVRWAPGHRHKALARPAGGTAASTTSREDSELCRKWPLPPRSSTRDCVVINVTTRHNPPRSRHHRGKAEDYTIRCIVETQRGRYAWSSTVVGRPHPDKSMCERQRSLKTLHREASRPSGVEFARESFRIWAGALIRE